MSLSTRFAQIVAPDSDNSDDEQIALEDKQLLARLLGKNSTQYSSTAGFSFGRGGTSIVYSTSDDDDQDEDLNEDWQKDFKLIIEKKKSAKEFVSDKGEAQKYDDSRSCLKCVSSQSSEYKTDEAESTHFGKPVSVELDESCEHDSDNLSDVDESEVTGPQDKIIVAICEISTESSETKQNETVCQTSGSLVKYETQSIDMKYESYNTQLSGYVQQDKDPECSLAIRGREPEYAVPSIKQSKQSNTIEMLKKKVQTLQNELKYQQSSSINIEKNVANNCVNIPCIEPCEETEKTQKTQWNKHDLGTPCPKTVKNKVSYSTQNILNTKICRKLTKQREEKKKKQYVIVPASSCPLDELLPIKKDTENKEIATVANERVAGIFNKAPTKASDQEGQQFYHQNVFPYASMQSPTFHGSLYPPHAGYGYQNIHQPVHYEQHCNPILPVIGSFQASSLSQYNSQVLETVSACRNVPSLLQTVPENKNWQYQAPCSNPINSADSYFKSPGTCIPQEQFDLILSAGKATSVYPQQYIWDSSVNDNVRPASPGFYQEHVNLNPSMDQSSEQSENGCEKLFELLIQQCSALIKTDEDRAKINTMLGELKKQGGDSLTGVGLKQRFDNLTGMGFTPTISDDGIAANDDLETAINNAPSPVPSPTRTLHEVFEGRTLLKGGVEPRHIPKTTVKKDGKHKPTDPRSFSAKTKDIKLKLPKFMETVWGKKIVEKVEQELSSKKGHGDKRSLVKTNLVNTNKDTTEVSKYATSSPACLEQSVTIVDKNLMDKKSVALEFCDIDSGGSFSKEERNAPSSLVDHDDTKTSINAISVLITNSVEKSVRNQNTRNPVLQNIINSFDGLGLDQTQFVERSTFFANTSFSKSSVGIVKPIQKKQNENSDKQQIDSSYDAVDGSKLDEVIVKKDDVDLEAAGIESLGNMRSKDADVKENVSEFEGLISVTDISDGELSDTSEYETPYSGKYATLELKTSKERALVSVTDSFDDPENQIPQRASKIQTASHPKSKVSSKPGKLKTRNRHWSNPYRDNMSKNYRPYRSSSSESSDSQWSWSERFSSCSSKSTFKDSILCRPSVSSSLHSNSRKERNTIPDERKHRSLSVNSNEYQQYNHQTTKPGDKESGTASKWVALKNSGAHARSDESEQNNIQRLSIRSICEGRVNDKHRLVEHRSISNRESFWKRSDAEIERQRRHSSNTQTSNVDNASRKRHNTSVDGSFNRSEKILKVDQVGKQHHDECVARHERSGCVNYKRSNISGDMVDARLKLDAKSKLNEKTCIVPAFQNSQSQHAPDTKYNSVGVVDLKIGKTFKRGENMNNIMVVIPGNADFKDNEHDKMKAKLHAKVSRVVAANCSDRKVQNSFELDRKFLEDYNKKLVESLKGEIALDERIHRAQGRMTAVENPCSNEVVGGD
ncbi:uncharacterized protein LOC127866738 [Dreissena polymorpha]|uniref:Uncharacterized protein n=1 Tax=Dreissena polymorpha TaxID=45954 RepID=A0A9D4LSH8_DREPO|nr:uncharacterized protein LOC127866738 [Dreissena polymorpha]KAH3864125.1 hypothetical protein DPMN_027139 [Dreissena polymorpha]